MDYNISPKARIIFLTDSFYPPDVGGLEKHTFHLADKLNSKGIKLFVIARKMSADALNFEQAGNVSIKRISPVGRLKGKGWKAIFPILLILITMSWILLKSMNRYDIIFVSGLKILSIPAIAAKLLLRKKCVIRIASPIEIWEPISYESLNKMKISGSSTLVKLLSKIRYSIIRRTDYFIPISSEISKQLNKINVSQQKIRLISNGIDTEKFHPVHCDEKMNIREKLDLPKDKIIFVFTGRLAQSKGVMLLAQIWEDLLQKRKDIYLLLVGTGEGSFDSCENELKGLINDHNLKENITITGNVENVHEYLMASDAFVFPSNYEGFGSSIIEAFACGLPSVVTKVGVAAEMIQNYYNGIVVSIDNEIEFKSAIEWLLDNRNLWSVIGENARKASEKYNIDLEANKYIDIFTKLCQNKKGNFSINNLAEVNENS